MMLILWNIYTKRMPFTAHVSKLMTLLHSAAQVKKGSGVVECKVCSFNHGRYSCKGNVVGQCLCG